MEIDEVDNVLKLKKREPQKIEKAYESRKRGQEELLNFVRKNKYTKKEVYCKEFEMKRGCRKV